MSKSVLALTLLCLACSADAQNATDPRGALNESDVTEMDAVEVVAPRRQELYRSKTVERTPPTVFERSWREPVDLEQVGMEGGVIPLFMRYLSKEAPKAAEKYIPGWTPQVRPAIARPPPLDDAQARRAAALRQTP